jgi:hypothetical protein
MGKKLGFTGTNRGMWPEQKTELEALLKKLKEEGFDEFHHGLCIGADEQAAILAKSIGYRVVAHPGLAKDPANLKYRSEWTGSDETLEAKPFIERDHDIVDVTERMVATPLTREEQLRSGTWTTVRYARTQNRLIDLVLPAFKPPKFAQAPPPRTNAIAGQDARTPPHMKRGVR